MAGQRGPFRVLFGNKGIGASEREDLISAWAGDSR